MSDLTQHLRNEHRFLTESLEEVYRLGISTADAQSKLGKVKNVLLQHLQREDADLYPLLEKKAAGDPRLAKLIDDLREEMRDVSKHALTFFEKYSGGGSGFEFARDFGQLSSMLSRRVRKEEAQLYPEFDRLVLPPG
jgi:DUF438 domain-containing protein